MTECRVSSVGSLEPVTEAQPPGPPARHRHGFTRSVLRLAAPRQVSGPLSDGLWSHPRVTGFQPHPFPPRPSGSSMWPTLWGKSSLPNGDLSAANRRRRDWGPGRKTPNRAVSSLLNDKVQMSEARVPSCDCFGAGDKGGFLSQKFLLSCVLLPTLAVTLLMDFGELIAYPEIFSFSVSYVACMKVISESFTFNFGIQAQPPWNSVQL